MKYQADADVDVGAENVGNNASNANDAGNANDVGDVNADGAANFTGR